MTAAKEQCAERDHQLEEATTCVTTLTTDFTSQVEEVRVRFELDKLGAIEQLRKEHVLKLKEELSNKERNKLELVHG